MRHGVHGDYLKDGKLDLPELLEVPSADDWEWARDFIRRRRWQEACVLMPVLAGRLAPAAERVVKAPGRTCSSRSVPCHQGEPAIERLRKLVNTIFQGRGRAHFFCVTWNSHSSMCGARP